MKGQKNPNQMREKEEDEIDPGNREIKRMKINLICGFKMLETLGLKNPLLWKILNRLIEKLSPRRTADRRAAMGDEIKEVAEKKQRDQSGVPELKSLIWIKLQITRFFKSRNSRLKR